jgi:predicted dehydrogenase
MIGMEHIAVLEHLSGCEVIAICDSNPESAARMLPGFTTDLSVVLADDRIDALWVCTPQHTHADIAVAALEAGKHVFCEKPIAHTVSDAERMITAAEQSDRILGIGHTMRFHPDLLAISEALRAGTIGTVVSGSFRWYVPDSEGRVIAPRTSLALEMAIHDADVVRWLLGDIREVYSTASSVQVTGLGPDAIATILTLKSGAIVTLEHGWILPAEGARPIDHRIAIFGVDGTAYYQDVDTPAQVVGRQQTLSFHSGYITSTPRQMAGALVEEDRAFINAIAGSTSWPLVLDDAVRALEISLAIATSLATGVAVEL